MPGTSPSPMERYKEEDHRISGWAVKVGLIRSLRRLSSRDANTLKEAIIQAKIVRTQAARL